jgi:hypothetical protein
MNETFFQEGTLMEIFWIVVYAYAGTVVFSIIMGMRKEGAEEFWTILAEISDHMIKRWNDNLSSSKTLQSSFRI